MESQDFLQQKTKENIHVGDVLPRGLDAAGCAVLR